MTNKISDRVDLEALPYMDKCVGREIANKIIEYFSDKNTQHALFQTLDVPHDKLGRIHPMGQGHQGRLAAQIDSLMAEDRIPSSYKDEILIAIINSFNPLTELAVKPREFRLPLALLITQSIELLLPELEDYLAIYPSIMSGHHTIKLLFDRLVGMSSVTQATFNQLKFDRVIQGNIRSSNELSRLNDRLNHINFALTVLFLNRSINLERLIRHHSRLFICYTGGDLLTGNTDPALHASDTEEDGLAFDPKISSLLLPGKDTFLDNINLGRFSRYQQPQINAKNREYPSAVDTLVPRQLKTAFEYLYNGAYEHSSIDAKKMAPWHAGVLLVMLLGIRVEIVANAYFRLFLREQLSKLDGRDSDTVILLPRIRDIPMHERYQSPEMKENLRTNGHHFFIPIPAELCRIYMSHQFQQGMPCELEANEQNVKRMLGYVYGAKLRTHLGVAKILKKPMENALHVLMFRQQARRHYADIVCGYPPTKSTGMFYSSDNAADILYAYADAVAYLASDTDYPTAYIQKIAETNTGTYIGSRVVVTPGYAREFMDRLYDAYQSEPDNMIIRFNLMVTYIWHVIMLMSGARPENRMPGTIKNVNLSTTASYILLDEKHVKTVDQHRILPLCDYARQLIATYVSYIEALANDKRSSKNLRSDCKKILSGKAPLLALMTLDTDSDQRLTPIRRGLIAAIAHRYHDGELPSNWPRHFTRTYMSEYEYISEDQETSLINDYLINYTMGHEAPGDELLGLPSSGSMSDLRPVQAYFAEMAENLGLKQLAELGRGPLRARIYRGRDGYIGIYNTPE